MGGWLSWRLAAGRSLKLDRKLGLGLESRLIVAIVVVAMATGAKQVRANAKNKQPLCCGQVMVR